MTPRLAPLCLAAALLGATLAGCSDDDADGDAASEETTADVSTGPTTTPSGPSTTAGAPETSPAIVFSGQGNNLVAYESTDPFASQVVITNAADDPESGRDINAQICFWDDPELGRLFVAGEDTGQPDPPAGWGIFRLDGSAVGELAATQIGKLTPTYQPGEQPENLGCGLLADGRMVTTDIGNQAGGDATGQLIVWFPPFDRYEVPYSKIDVAIGTAQSILVGPDDEVYVASSLGRGEDNPAGVYRYTGELPTGPTPEDGCDGEDGTGAPLATTGITKDLFIPADAEVGLAFPAGLAWAPDGGFYVSSVASGTINEYGADGTYVRTILEPEEGEVLDADSYQHGTPLGMATAPDGTLFVADIGVVNTTGEDGSAYIGPGDGNGRVLRLGFDDEGTPEAPVTMDEGLDYPDNIGIFVP
jgi:hypothetical protein